MLKFNPNYFGAPILERKYNENHGPDGRFVSAGDALFSYTSGGYHDIKQADKGKLKNNPLTPSPSVNHYIAEAAAINNYLAEHSTDHENLHRGMVLTEKQAEKFLSQKEITLDSMTSFTTSKDTARMSFARPRGKQVGVVITVNKVKGANISKFSKLFTGETEVLAGKGQKFRITHVSEKDFLNTVHVTAEAIK